MCWVFVCQPWTMLVGISRRLSWLRLALGAVPKELDTSSCGHAVRPPTRESMYSYSSTAVFGAPDAHMATRSRTGLVPGLERPAKCRSVGGSHPVVDRQSRWVAAVPGSNWQSLLGASRPILMQDHYCRLVSQLATLKFLHGPWPLGPNESVFGRVRSPCNYPRKPTPLWR